MSTPTSGSDQQGPGGSAGRSGDADPDSTSQDEDGRAQSSTNMDLPRQSSSQSNLPPQSSRQADVPSITTSTPKKRTDAASAARRQMLEHDRSQAGLKKVTFANPAAERRSTRPRKGVDKLGGFPVFAVTQEGDEAQNTSQIISAPPSRPTSPDLHDELETNTLLQSNSNARDTSSTGVANSSQQPPPPAVTTCR